MIDRRIDLPDYVCTDNERIRWMEAALRECESGRGGGGRENGRNCERRGNDCKSLRKIFGFCTILIKLVVFVQGRVT